MDEAKQLALALEGMGAEPQQADVMAKQLLKRAEQIAERDGVSKVEALAKLLALVKSGREGESYDQTDESGGKGLN